MTKKLDVHEVLVRMAQIAIKNGYCGAWYAMEGRAVQGLCMKPIPKGSESTMCPECDGRSLDRSEGVEHTFKLVKVRNPVLRG
jgi:hypothetical protein